jgi:sulfonate transport system ATP-binding protein
VAPPWVWGALSVYSAITDLVIDAGGIIRRFEDRMVLDHLDIEVGRGEFVCVIGRSGAGKSTLLRVLAGLDRQFTGNVTITKQRGLMFQDPCLLPWQRVLTNVTLGLPGRSAPDRGLAVLGEVGLQGRAKSWPQDLSGGERQRVALARALVRSPEVLLLDEPFGALDAFTRAQMQELLLQISQEHASATLLVTHDIDEALSLGDRVLVLSRGRFTLNLGISLPRPRDRTTSSFAAMRAALLTSLEASRPPSTSQSFPTSHPAAGHEYFDSHNIRARHSKRYGS